jgi:hypothetical protein
LNCQSQKVLDVMSARSYGSWYRLKNFCVSVPRTHLAPPLTA